MPPPFDSPSSLLAALAEQVWFFLFSTALGPTILLLILLGTVLGFTSGVKRRRR